MPVSITVADHRHYSYAPSICAMMEAAAKVRGTGIAKRDPKYLTDKMKEGQAVIALDGRKLVGFCYIESWENKKFVANSGLIIHPDYRNQGLARAIKKATFQLSKEKFPQARLFGITTSMAVMKINSSLGYKPVTFSELTRDEKFWQGCRSCTNYDILQRTHRKMCLCTAMVCDLKEVRDGTPAEERSRAGFAAFLKDRKERLKQSLDKLPHVIHRIKLF